MIVFAKLLFAGETSAVSGLLDVGLLPDNVREVIERRVGAGLGRMALKREHMDDVCLGLMAQRAPAGVPRVEIQERTG